MAFDGDPQRPGRGPSERKQLGRDETHADTRRKARMGREWSWPCFETIDVVQHNEGELVGFFLGVPYDWDVLDPFLMHSRDELMEGL